MKYTAEQLKKMNPQDFTQATKKLPLNLRLDLAMFAGAGEQGIGVYEGKDMANGKFSHKKLDYESLAECLNLMESGKSLSQVAGEWSK